MIPSARRLLVAALCACAALGAPAAEAGAAEPAARGSAISSPARLLVTAHEWGLALSRRRVVAGPIVVQLDNRGEDPHDLRLRRLNRRGRVTGRTISMPETASGGLGEIEDRLRRGRWRLWCSLPGHRALGMRATLRAR